MDNPYLMRSFEAHLGQRGVHLYTSLDCEFLSWTEVLQFLKKFNKDGDYYEFENSLITNLANYNPDNEFLALCESSDDRVAIEMYLKAP
jgi:hypothetical protein